RVSLGTRLGHDRPPAGVSALSAPTKGQATPSSVHIPYLPATNPRKVPITETMSPAIAVPPAAAIRYPPPRKPQAITIETGPAPKNVPAPVQATDVRMKTYSVSSWPRPSLVIPSVSPLRGSTRHQPVIVAPSGNEAGTTTTYPAARSSC